MSDFSSSYVPPNMFPFQEEFFESLATQESDGLDESQIPLPSSPDMLYNNVLDDPMDIDSPVVDVDPNATNNMSATTLPHRNTEHVTKENPEEYQGNNITPLPSLDLADRISGYRLLELISEQASNGLVDKVIISQEPLSSFINYISPGAYTSLTRVDFATLDQFLIKPIGVYGSKSEIVRLLLEIRAVDEETASLLLSQSIQDSAHEAPTLASGLYIFEAPSETDTVKRFYVVYWPEDTTWDDDATSAVAKNRVTFMRYLTKVTDQILALISPEHARELDFKKFSTDDMAEDEVDYDDDQDRMFNFSVAQTNEQSESVTVHPGFEFPHRLICEAEAPSQIPTELQSALHPRLVAGETQQAFLTAQYKPEEFTVRPSKRIMTEVELRSQISDNGRAIHLDEELTDEGLTILSKLGLEMRFPAVVNEWKKQNETSEAELSRVKKLKRDETESKLVENRSRVQTVLRNIAIHKILDIYGAPFTAAEFADNASWKMDTAEVQASMEYLQKQATMFSEVRHVQEQGLRDLKPYHISEHSVYKRLKNRFQVVAHILKTHDDWENYEKQKLVDAISASTGDLTLSLPERLSVIEKGKGKSTGIVSHWMHSVSKAITSTKAGPSHVIHSAREAVSSEKLSDPIFICQLPTFCDREPLLVKPAFEIVDVVMKELKLRTEKFVNQVYESLHRVLLKQLDNQIQRELGVAAANEKKSSRLTLIRHINQSSGSTSNLGITFQNVTETRGWSYGSDWGSKRYDVSSREGVQTHAHFRYTVNLLALTEDDRHKLLLESGYDHVPRPQLRPYPPTFCLPVEQRIRHIQLLKENRCILIVGNEQGDLKVFLNRIDDLDNAVKVNRPAVSFSHTKLGSNIIFTIDETRALLVLVSSDESNACRLHIYRFIEDFSALVARGTPITLHSWHDKPLCITAACFVSGQEEIFLVDNLEGRIYSFVTQQWRPAPLHFMQSPYAVFSTPDGGCLVTIELENQQPYTRVYHWASFGSSEGIVIDIPNIDPASFGITSLAQRNVVHALILSPSYHTLRSISLHITRKSSEFIFRSKDDKENVRRGSHGFTQHNSLLDCHYDTWTRFPVVPAISRSTIRPGDRMATWLQFVTEDVNLHQLFAPYWSAMIANFETSTRKPIDDTIQRRYVVGTHFDILSNDWCRTSSQYHAGEWLVELLCLIPIQICVTRDNRFLPLKDGVWSPDVERSLLGADLAQVVESITFGWYESLLQSYYTGKKVKVVSSMGQQSVGKSYMINHLTDCSFQGSAMRTTEGCWMSLTPTDEHLVVSLDFEGLDSIERSAQEDTLLVLFNAAISNLVLFRNNFALSRDITTSFQSFQSSSLVLNPASNPTLFQGRLAIIVKDVIDSDHKEIVKEFSGKLQRIVGKEQGSNFITRLHKGEMAIIPWPVIESRKFYTTFYKLKKVLYSQPVTHPGAGVFLSTMKTLMAKLKTNDWGALDQNLGALRAQTLERMLPAAFIYGTAEADTEIPLKDIDSDTVIPSESDYNAVFYLQSYSMDPCDASSRLAVLRENFSSNRQREDPEWTSALSSHINTLGEARIKHVLDWFETNSSRFSSHADIVELGRKLQDAVVQLKTGLQLCKMECQNCRLLCIETRHHPGNHTCLTNHACSIVCDFCDGCCGLPAGHDSKHVCTVAAHLCGEPCDLGNKRGCLGKCTKAIDHSDTGHLCSARNHDCGEPCALENIRLQNGSQFTCNGRCVIPCDEPHDTHVCNERSCPISCQLCKRFCSLEHLHGLDEDTHLCGQEHPCGALCGAQGACEISNAPLRVESTFTGKLETFQFTKYSQVVKRLPCGLNIPEGALSHEGLHRHSISPDAFHHCEVRCPNCDYLCTLPHGHTQREHETSHGSCSKTQWAIEGREDAVLELDGHKYAANDSGAPFLCSMMCTAFGRHAHIEYCRAEGTFCEGPQLQHINARMLPHPDKPKDYVSHELYWERTGFKDPYTQEDQADFANCDNMCGGPEHEGAPGVPAQPSYCTLPMFHDPQPLSQPSSAQGYVSTNGHDFVCKNPSVGHQSFHVIFVIDRSGSMYSWDREPQRGSLGNNRICDYGYTNRLGAVYSALYGFWTARNAALTALTGQGGAPPRRDAYSVILFTEEADTTPVVNDFTASPDDLLNILLPYGPEGGTCFDAAILQAHSVLESNWSTERSPVIIFLSDGECSVSDNSMYDLAQKSLALGKALSFHSVSFGPDGSSYYLRRMADIAKEVFDRAPRDPLAPPGASPCSYTEALDTIRLAETFLGFAASLQKQRGSLLRG